MNFDVLIRGAQIFPGDEPARRADVGVQGDRIAAVQTSLEAGSARTVIEGDGLILCPGFIDMHAHSALEPFHNPDLAPKIAQGFTTEVINPDGLAPAPVVQGRQGERRSYLLALEGPGPKNWTWSTMAEYIDALDRTCPATTLVPSIGHNAVRDRVMGGVNRQATTSELRSMRREVRAGIEAGARTLSFGLIYLPGAFADTDELIELAKEAALFGVPLVPHVRNEGNGVLQALNEMIKVARQSGAPLHVSHLKVVGCPDLVEPLLELIDEAGRDIDITFDQYPYGAGSTLLSALLPAWAQEGEPSATLSRLQDASERRRVARDVKEGIAGWENLYRACGPENIYVSHAGSGRLDDIGKTLAQIGEERKCDPFVAVLDLLVDTRLDVAMIDHYAAEETVRAIFRHPRALVGSDAIFGAHPHPRLYGTAARVLGRYAFQEKLIPVESAVARLTAQAAARIGLSDRGRIREGLRADLVLLDPAQYIDIATYDSPKCTPPGVHRVLVGGQVVWKDGKGTGMRCGSALGEDGRPSISGGKGEVSDG